jgi:hypothetical protein
VVEGKQSWGRRQWRWNFNGACYGTWKQGRGGNGVRQFSERNRGRRQGTSTELEVDDTPKSVTAVEVAEGSGWHLEVEDD